MGKHILLGGGLYTEVFRIWGFLWEMCFVGDIFFLVLTDNKISFPVTHKKIITVNSGKKLMKIP